MKKLLNDIRQEQRHSFQKLSNVSGLSRSYLAKIFSDDKTPVPFENESFQKILDYYGLPYYDISVEATEKSREGCRHWKLKKEIFNQLSVKVNGCSKYKAIAPVIQAIIDDYFYSKEFEKLDKKQFLAHMSVGEYFKVDSSTLSLEANKSEYVESSFWDFLSCFDRALLEIKELIRINLNSVTYNKGLFGITYLDRHFTFKDINVDRQFTELEKLYLSDKDFKNVVDAVYSLAKK